MQIAYLSNSIIPSRSANSVHVMKMCEAFSDLGHQVWLFSKMGEGKVADIHSFYGVKKDFEVGQSSNLNLRIFGSLRHGWVANAKLAERLSVDLVFSRDLWGAYFSARRGIPLVLEVHAPPANLVYRSMMQRTVDRPNFKALIVISEALKKIIKEHIQISDEKIIVAHDAASEWKLNGEPMRDWPGRTEALQVGYVGHLYRGRGIEIIAGLAERRPQMDFHIVGGHESDLKYYRELYRSQTNLIFHGFVPHGNLSVYFQKFDVVLAPYQAKVAVHGGGGDTSRWMSPLKLFEYMSARKPVICSRIEVIEEVLTHDQTALLVDNYGEVEGWLEALNRMEDPDLRKTISNKGYARYNKHHTWRARAAEILKRIGV